MENKPNLTLTVDSVGAGMRLDRWLAAREPFTSRSLVAKLIDEGRVTLFGRICKASYRVEEGDVFEIDIPAPTISQLTPYHLQLDVLFEDQDLLVVNKPAGLVVHPAAGHVQDTLVNALLAHTRDLSMGFHEQRPGIVHRLDKDTSGLLVVAKNNRAHEALAQQFKSKTAHRVYWAVVVGEPRAKAGTIRSRLLRHPSDRKRFASTKKEGEGRLAITHFQVVSKKSGLSLLALKLDTGRTHQIRVHLSEAGYPIVGDTLYGGRSPLKRIESARLREICSALNRFVLHAAELGFLHPTKGEFLKFKVGWPAELSPLIDHCGWSLEELNVFS